MLSGRDREIDEIVENCKAARLVVLTAEPGFGATALLNEAIAPALISRGFITVVASQWQGKAFAASLNQSIAQAVRDQINGPFSPPEDISLSELLRGIRTGTGRAVALLFDRFEDYPRCHSGSDISDAFDAELSHAIAGRDACFVIALHRDALPAFSRFAQYIPNLLGFQIELGPLDMRGARELVRLEGEKRGIEVEPPVLDLLVSAPIAQAAGGVHPFYLMAGVTRLLDSARDQRMGSVGVALVEVCGGAVRLILESLDDKIATLSPTHAELFFRWGNLLISQEGRRECVAESTLADYSGKLNRFAVSLLPRLLELGIVRSIELNVGMRYEIARESLTPLVRDWWKRRELELIARRKAKFRLRSISVAVGSIVALYAIWLLMTMKR